MCSYNNHYWMYEYLSNCKDEIKKRYEECEECTNPKCSTCKIYLKG